MWLLGCQGDVGVQIDTRSGTRSVHPSVRAQRYAAPGAGLSSTIRVEPAHEREAVQDTDHRTGPDSRPNAKRDADTSGRPMSLPKPTIRLRFTVITRPFLRSLKICL